MFRIVIEPTEVGKSIGRFTAYRRRDVPHAGMACSGGDLSDVSFRVRPKFWKVSLLVHLENHVICGAINDCAVASPFFRVDSISGYWIHFVHGIRPDYLGDHRDWSRPGTRSTRQ